MAEYKAIHGTLFQHKTSDPLATGVGGATWSTGGSLNLARNGIAGAGIQTAAIAFGGYSGSTKDETEQYDGSSWTEVGDLNTARYILGGTGTTTAALACGGNPRTGVTELWDNSSWTESGDLNTARQAHGSAGTTTAGIAFTGSASTGNTVNAEEFDGSSWTEVANLNSARDNVADAGTQTAAFCIGGTTPPGDTIKKLVESWDGSSWTEIADMNTARRSLDAGGTTTDALAFGGTPGYLAITEAWNGTAWTEVSDLNTGRAALGGGSQGSSTTLNIAFGGEVSGGSVTAITEEFTAATITDSIKRDGQTFYRSDTGDFKISLTQFGTGAFASGGAIPAVKSAHGFAGTQTAGVAFAGATSTTAKVATSYEYNGTAWSDANDVNTTRDLCAGAGTQTAAILFGGTLPPGGHSNATELYDGTNWTTSPGTFSSQARSRIGPLGTQTAALAVSGTPISPVDQAVESWNGSSWTEIAEINTSRINGGAAGIQTAGLFFGGEDPLRALTENWDGTAWTEVGDMNTARQSSGMGAGIQTAAMAIGGEVSPGFTANAETWNGSSWTEVANLGTARGYHACGGTTLSAIATGGRTPTYVANTEEWTVPESISNLTITD